MPKMSVCQISLYKIIFYYYSAEFSLRWFSFQYIVRRVYLIIFRGSVDKWIWGGRWMAESRALDPSWNIRVGSLIVSYQMAKASDHEKMDRLV